MRTLCPADCKDASDILIYGQLLETDHSDPTSSTSADALPVLQLRAAHILTPPPLQKQRLPRPDDPVPRFPPLLMRTKKRRAEESPSTRLKRRKEEAVLQNARNVMTCMPSADVALKANRPQMLSRAKTLPDDVFKVPHPPVLKGKGKGVDIAKELEKANKAVSRARFLYFPTYPELTRWLNVLRVIASLNMGSKRLMRTLKKSGVLYTAGLNLLWFVQVLIRGFCMLKAKFAEKSDAVTCYRESCCREVCQGARRDVRQGDNTRSI